MLSSGERYIKETKLLHVLPPQGPTAQKMKKSLMENYIFCAVTRGSLKHH